YDVTLAFGQTNNRGFARVATATATLAPLAHSAVVGFVHLHARVAAAQLEVLGHEAANLAEHSPSGLVSDSGFPLYLLCRNAAARRTHEIHGVEPQAKRGTGFLEDGSRQGIDVI